MFVLTSGYRVNTGTKCGDAFTNIGQIIIINIVFIIFIVLRFGLDQLVLKSFQKPWLTVIARIFSLGRNLSAPRGQRVLLR